ncbi:MAG TPA: 4Fe-4S ferredoxin [Lentisphaeria bacterium]|nr:MAG: hypothetical protein A2X45_00590 [Lentisphaerae bacterium GWF2_50_93]HCE45973.1 4Fe-4S ferredoxin [Lentisphaeria bacterium]
MIDPEVLVKLIDRLDSYPVGLPDAPEIREFLNIFLSPDEAYLASIFPFKEVTSIELASHAGWGQEKVESTLNSLAEKGAVFDFKLEEGRVYWLLTPSVFGFIEFSMMKIRRDLPMGKLAGLLDAYEENHLKKEVFGSKTQISRALVDFDVPVSSQIMTTSEIEQLIIESGGGCAQTCYCRQKKQLLGKGCTLTPPQETCFTISKAGADFLVRRGFGVRITAEEMIGRVRKLGKLGLIHVTDNIRSKPSFICNCCGCCCVLLSGITQKKIPHAVSPTQYILNINRELCRGCGRCAEKCQIKSISIGNKKAELDSLNCLGCGSCIKFCGHGALSLVARSKPPRIPKTDNAKFLRIAFEKGKLPAMAWRILKSKFW